MPSLGLHMSSVARLRGVGSRALLVALLAGLACAGASQPAFAQPLAAKPVQQSGLTEQQLDQLLAARMYRTAMLDLRAAVNPQANDFAIAQAALRHAKVFAPQSAELVRAMISAAYAADDDAMVIDLTRDLVRLDPSDTVAQLRLLSTRIRSLQTVEQRTATYDRLLGTDGDKLDASVRSRLALDAALLAREVGNERGFADRLKQAVQLDASNKDAALLALSFASQQPLDARSRFELLSNLLLSDPLDPAVHLQMRDELAQGGAYVQAERFHSTAMRISGAGEGLVEQLEGLALRWRTSGPITTLNELNKLLAIAKDQQRRALEASGENNINVADVRSPDDIRLPIELDELRVAAASVAGNAEALAAAVTDLAKTHAERSTLLRDPVRRGNMDEGQALADATQSDVESIAWRMLFAADGKVAAEGLAAVVDALPDKANDGRASVLKTLAAFAIGDDASVLSSTEGVGPDEPYRAIPRGLVLAKQSGKVREAAALLRDVERTMPLTALGAFAGSKATALDMSSSHAEAATLGTLARGIPAWVDAMATKPGVFQMLTVEHDRLRATALDVVALNAKVRNVASVPLAVGENKTIGSRVALTPRLEVSPPELALLLQGEVLELDRKLRLMPGEELTASVLRPEAGMLSWVIGSGSSSPTRLRYRALQGFGFDMNGVLAPGAGCVDTTTGTLERESMPLSRLSMAELTEKVRTAYASELPEVLIAARALLMREEIARRTANGGVLTQASSMQPSAEAVALVQALAEAYPTWNPVHRALSLTELPFAGDVPAIAAFDAVAEQETEPSVLPMVILTRVARLESPALSTARDSVSEQAKQLAAAQRNRIEAGGATLATRGLLVTAGNAGTTRLPPEVQPAQPREVPASEKAPAAQPPTSPAQADPKQPELPAPKLEPDLTLPGTTLPPTTDPTKPPATQPANPPATPPGTL